MTYAFDSTKVEDTGGDYDVIPAGAYKAIIDNTEIKTTKKGDGEYLQITYKIISEKYKGRLLWGIYNIKNPSEQAQNIGQSQLKKVCEAVDKLTFKAPYELHGRQLLLNVIIKSNEKYGESNKIKSVQSLGAMAKPVATPSNIVDEETPKAETPAAEASTDSTPQSTAEELDDEIPF